MTPPSHRHPTCTYCTSVPLSLCIPKPIATTEAAQYYKPCSSKNDGECVHAVRDGYIDPTPTTAIFQIAATYGFTTLMINVGTSYFRRLAASNYAMMEVSLSSPQFCPFMLPFEEYPPNSGPKPLVGAIHAKYLPTNEAWLTLIHLTCIYMAAKNLEYVPCKNMLQTMMGHIYGADPCNVATDLVTELELECLTALDWRLGPFYRTDS